MGPFDPDQTQIHDVNPGDLNDRGKPDHFVEGGLFWTGRIRRPAVRLRGQGNAEMSLTDYALFDFIDVGGAVGRPPGHTRDPATASIDAVWTPTGNVRNVRQQRFSGNGRFEGKYWETTVECDWSIENLETGYAFSTEGSSERTVTSQFSAKIRNGVFAA